MQQTYETKTLAYKYNLQLTIHKPTPAAANPTYFCDEHSHDPTGTRCTNGAGGGAKRYELSHSAPPNKKEPCAIYKIYKIYKNIRYIKYELWKFDI